MGNKASKGKKVNDAANAPAPAPGGRSAVQPVNNVPQGVQTAPAPTPAPAAKAAPKGQPVPDRTETRSAASSNAPRPVQAAGVGSPANVGNQSGFQSPAVEASRVPRSPSPANSSAGSRHMHHRSSRPPTSPLAQYNDVADYRDNGSAAGENHGSFKARAVKEREEQVRLEAERVAHQAQIVHEDYLRLQRQIRAAQHAEAEARVRVRRDDENHRRFEHKVATQRRELENERRTLKHEEQKALQHLQSHAYPPPSSIHLAGVVPDRLDLPMPPPRMKSPQRTSFTGLPLDENGNTIIPRPRRPKTAPAEPAPVRSPTRQSSIVATRWRPGSASRVGIAPQSSLMSQGQGMQNGGGEPEHVRINLQDLVAPAAPESPGRPVFSTYTRNASRGRASDLRPRSPDRARQQEAPRAGSYAAQNAPGSYAAQHAARGSAPVTDPLQFVDHPPHNPSSPSAAYQGSYAHNYRKRKTLNGASPRGRPPPSRQSGSARGSDGGERMRTTATSMEDGGARGAAPARVVAYDLLAVDDAIWDEEARNDDRVAYLLRKVAAYRASNPPRDRRSMAANGRGRGRGSSGSYSSDGDRRDARDGRDRRSNGGGENGRARDSGRRSDRSRSRSRSRSRGRAPPRRDRDRDYSYSGDNGDAAPTVQLDLARGKPGDERNRASRDYSDDGY